MTMLINHNQLTMCFLLQCILLLKTSKKTFTIIKTLERELSKKSKEFSKIVKVGRTHLQDIPFNSGSRILWISFPIKKVYFKNRSSFKRIYYLAQGGTAVGTGLNTRKNFDKK